MVYLAIVYLLVRYGLTRHLDSLGVYASYVFEFAVIAVGVGLARRGFLEKIKISTRALPFIAVAFGAGFSVFLLSTPLGIAIPFDLGQTETILFLLLIGPLIEELLFRFVLWQGFAQVGAKWAFPVTTILFSYSHFHSYWIVDSQFYPFVFYQTAYTAVLSLICGYLVLKKNSWTGAWLAHLAFNLGFYLGGAL